MTRESPWWERPYRTFQTNLREIDAVLDEKKVVGRIVELGASAWLLNTAGIGHSIHRSYLFNIRVPG